MSQPGGASAYVDDELVGSTDPETGRLVKSGLRAGRHRVRMARAGDEDAVRDIDVPKDGSATFYAVLKPRGEDWLGTRAGLVAFAVVAVALITLLARIAVRRSREARPRSGPPRPYSAGRSREECGRPPASTPV